MKKRIMGTNKLVTPILRTVVPLGDDPKHELVVLEISRLTTTGKIDEKRRVTNSIQIRAVTDFKRQPIKPKPSH